VARRAARDFDAVWFVALEPVPDPNDAMGALARVMELPEVPGVDWAERVLTHLLARRVLLVLDNLDHLHDVAPLVGRLAHAGPDVRILVTSQAPLRVGGEHVLALDPLALPTGGEHELGALRTVPSVALLLERAANGFALTEGNRFDVANLCRRLEGVPLALELAARRLPGLEPAAVSGALEQQLEALEDSGDDVPARHRGLRAMLEWTVGRLSDGERALLARLSVFAAGFSLDLARAAYGEIVEELQALADAGLVRVGATGRYEIPPPVRRFAAALLDAEEEDAAHGAISDALIALAEPFETRWLVAAGEGRLALNPEAGNIFAELDWSSLMDYGRHTRLAAATGWWMTHAGAGEYARDHLEIALARTTAAQLRARCLQALSTLGLQDSDPSACLDAADAWHDLADVDGEFYSAIYGAHLYGYAREAEAQMDLLQRCTALAAATPQDRDKRWILDAICAEATSVLGRPEEALDLLRPWLDEAPAGSSMQVWIAGQTADLELVLHQFDSALAHAGLALKAVAPLRSVSDQLGPAVRIAVALLHLGRAEDAATTWAVCELGFDELSWQPRGTTADWFEAVRAGVDEPRLAAGRRSAARMGVDNGLAWVARLAGDEAVPAAGSRDSGSRDDD
jgi:predicted ATPase